MPRGEIYKIPVNKNVFMAVVKECDSSIIKLGACDEIECSERTILLFSILYDIKTPIFPSN